MAPENICVFEAARGDKFEEDMSDFYPVSEEVVQAIYDRLNDFIAKVNAELSELVLTARK